MFHDHDRLHPADDCRNQSANATGGNAEKSYEPCDGRHSSPHISGNFRTIQTRGNSNALEEKIFVLVTCVIGRSLHGELLHSRTVGHGRYQMSNTRFFAVTAAALVVACVA